METIQGVGARLQKYAAAGAATAVIFREDKDTTVSTDNAAQILLMGMA
jgi:hypothetical protein